MAYEIPQELEYQEKIVFNLTFKQMMWAMIFSPFVIVILMKLPYNLYYRIGLSLIPSGIACIFMFTKLPKLVYNWWKWLPYRRLYISSPKMKTLLKLSKVENDVLHLKNNKLSIIKVEPINFGIKNDQEKEVVILAFQKFLNSLDFPIQIVIATDELNLDHYLNQLEERSNIGANLHYKQILKDHKAHLKHIINNQGLLNRSFYLVIPEKKEIGLSIQVGVCEELLRNMNLRFTRLKEDELMYCLSGFFNDLYQDDNKDLSHIGRDDILHYKVSPQFIINKPNMMKVGEKFVRTIAVKGYPRIVEEGFLDKIVTLNGDFDLSIHIDPFPIETMMINLNRELQKQRSDLWSMKNKGIINPALEVKFKDTRQVLEQLQKGNEKLFNVSLYITCKGKTEKELNLLSKKVESELNSLMMIPFRPTHEMHKALISAVPLGTNKLNIKRNITTKPLSAFFPFTSQFLEVDETGIWLGLNKTNIPIIKDIYKLQNANGVVLASSGGGKSYFTKLMISRMLLNGTKVMVVDPQAEYKELTKKFYGQNITISKNSKTIINPLDLMGHDYDEKKLTLLDLFPLMIGALSDIQKAVLDKALTATYFSKGITRDKKTWINEPPVMSDLLLQLKKQAKDTTNIEKETYRSLINRFEMYSTGVFSFLNKQTQIDFNNNLVCFNIGNMPSQVKPAIMFLILDYVYMKMKRSLERKFLVVDEAWSLLQRTEDEGYIFKIVKTCRKFHLGLLLITQDAEDLLSNNAGKALLNNSEYTLLLRQKPSVIDQIEKTFRLSKSERQRLLTASSGQGIIIINNEHSEIKIIASPEEHKIITTNPEDKLQDANPIITKYRKYKINPDKGLFKKNELNNEEIKLLQTLNYKPASLIGIKGGRQEEYFIKPRHNESNEHFFVTKIIEEEIRKYTDKVELYTTQEADIVFYVKGKKYAVEVETGKKIYNDRKKVEAKVVQLKKRYGDNWFFVVTDWTYKEKYAKLGTTYVRKEVIEVLRDMFGKGDENGKTRTNM